MVITPTKYPIKPTTSLQNVLNIPWVTIFHHLTNPVPLFSYSSSSYRVPSLNLATFFISFHRLLHLQKDTINAVPQGSHELPLSNSWGGFGNKMKPFCVSSLYCKFLNLNGHQAILSNREYYVGSPFVFKIIQYLKLCPSPSRL